MTAVAPVLAADDDRGAAAAVAGGVDALPGQHEQRAGAFDLGQGAADAGLEAVLHVDQRGHDLGRVDVAAAHLGQVDAPLAERLAGQRLGIGHHADRGDGVVAQVGADEQRLVVGVADDADAAAPAQALEVGVELRAELGVLDVVDDADEPLGAQDGQAAALGPQVGMVVGAVKQVGQAIVLCRHAEKSAHQCPPGQFGF